MARVIGNPFGEFRGKLAGNVWSKNAAGAIIRLYVIPVDRNTIAQQDSRNNFRNSAQFWKTLTQVAQQAWNDFAVATFNPLRKVNLGQYTGNQAQVSVRAAVLNAIGQSFSAAYVALDAGIAPAGTDGVFAPALTPPLTSVQANLKQTSGPPLTYIFQNLIVSASGALQFDARFSGIPAANDQDDFIDENGVPYSWKCYLSDPVSQVGGRPKNDFFNSLGSALPVTFAITTLAGLNGVQIAWNFSSLIPKMLSFVSVGQIAKMTISCISLDGTMIRSFSDYVTIT